MGYGALSAADYFDVNAGDANPKVYSFKWGRNGWGDKPMLNTNTKPIGSSTVTPGTYAPDKNSFLGNTSPTCTGSGSALVQCVGWSAIQGSSSGFGAWASTSDASYRPVDIRESGELGSDIPCTQDGSCSAYSLNIPYKDMFDAAGGYANLQNLDETWTGGSPAKKYVFYNKTQHTALAAGMAGRMLGYDTVGMRNGLPGWNNTVGQQLSGDSDAVSVGVMLGQATGSLYAGTIAPGYTTNSGLDVGLIITGLSVIGNVGAPDSVTIVWDTDYPGTTMINDKDTYNDTVLNTSHSAALSGLTPGTYTYDAISYDCVANNVQSSITFIFANMNISPTTLNLKSKGDYVTVVLKGYDTTTTNIDTSDTNPATCPLLLNGSLCAVSASSTADSVMVKFDRAAVGILTGVPGTYIMTISAWTTDATPIPIVGSSIMNVIQ